MEKIGIICEYNPFHNGHLYHINKIKEMYPDSLIILVMSTNFTQRGEISLLNKNNKTLIALNHNIDLVIELPFIFSTQSADIFAKGSIEILNKLKVDKLIFGSESNDIEKLTKLSEIQLNNSYKDNLQKYLKQGLNYPTSLSKSLKELTDLEIKSPNDLLAISYIKAILKTNSNIKPISIKRTNDYHSNEIKNNIISASNIRNLLKDNKDITNFVPNETLQYIKNISLENYYPILKYKVISDDLTKYQDVNINLNNALKKHIMNSNSIEELIMNVKSKNYTYNKIKRCLVHILCNYEKQECKINYIRVLGFNKKGQNYLNKIKKNIDLPIITNYCECLNKELEVDKFYSLMTDNNIIKKELIGPIKED